MIETYHADWHLYQTNHGTYAVTILRVVINGQHTYYKGRIVSPPPDSTLTYTSLVHSRQAAARLAHKQIAEMEIPS